MQAEKKEQENYFLVNIDAKHFKYSANIVLLK